MIGWHVGRPPAPHDLWAAWTLDPVLVVGVLLATWAYARGRMRSRRRVDGWRDGCFVAGLVAVGVALVSPLDALATALASAHMVQHLLLVLVAAPLLAVASPWSTLVRGTPAPVRRLTARSRRRLGLTRRTTRTLRNPVVAGLLYVANLWVWHGSVPYGAALRHDAVHALEHACFLATGLLLWTVTVDGVRGRRPSPGARVLLQFVIAMQGVFLSAMLTFAETPWYAAYGDTTRAWQLTPVEDQQLAGLVLWLPGGLVHLAAALVLLVVWVRRSEPDPPRPAGPVESPDGARMDRHRGEGAPR